MNEVPEAGNSFIVSVDEMAVKKVADARKNINQHISGHISKLSSNDAYSSLTSANNSQEQLRVRIVLKSDCSGSLEAIKHGLMSLSASDNQAVCMIDIISQGIGDVTASDVAVSSAVGASIVAFNVNANQAVSVESKRIGVEIGTFNVIYSLLDHAQALLEKYLNPGPPGTFVGRAEIIKVFKVGKDLSVAGCKLTSGRIVKDSNVRILRGSRNTVYSGRPSSLKNVKTAVEQIDGDIGTEFGISFEEGYGEFEVGDIVECFTVNI